MKPAYVTIAAVSLAVLSAFFAMVDIIPTEDAALLIGLAIVLAILGLRE